MNWTRRLSVPSTRQHRGWKRLFFACTHPTLPPQQLVCRLQWRQNQTNLNSLRATVVWRLCKPGIVAAGWQAVAVLAVTISITLISSLQLSIFGIGSIARTQNAALLSWSYFLTGLGVALTSSQLVNSGAEDIRRASRLMHPKEPKRAVTILFAQLCLVAIVLGVLGLTQALETTLHAAKPAELTWKGLIGLSSIYSVCLAAFGNMARAAYKALD